MYQQLRGVKTGQGGARQVKILLPTCYEEHLDIVISFSVAEVAKCRTTLRCWCWPWIDSGWGHSVQTGVSSQKVQKNLPKGDLLFL